MRTIIIFALIGAACAYCPNSCNGHGDCADSDVCSCHPFWTANDCSQRQCPFGLSWTTSSDWKLSNSATPGYHTSAESSLKGGFHAYAECSNRGQCDRDSGLCKCFPGFSGKACRRSSCPNDCSGHGLCALDHAVNNDYGDNNLLFSQKQYWNGRKTQSCVCDPGYSGNDCAQRICPQNSDPTSGCESASDSKDVQLVTVKYKNLATATAATTEQFFTLSFTDQFNNKFTTKPLSFFDNPATVQQALMALPNFAIPDVQVQKVWPDAQYKTGTKGTAVTDSSLHKEGRQQEGAKHCATAYYKNFEDVSCNTKADCTKKFGLDAKHVICDVSITDRDNNRQDGAFTGTNKVGGKGVCVETDLTIPADKAVPVAVCQIADKDQKNFQKTIADFDATDTASKRTTIDHLCGYSAGQNGNFEPDGIYQSEDKTETGYYLGRRLTAFERGCYHGKFAGSDLVYAKVCTSDKDCERCGGWTSVRAGSCQATAGGTKKCLPRNDGNVKYTNGWADATECSRASFVIKFTDDSTNGKQNTLTCQYGTGLSDQAGASPKFPSEALTCGVLHVGLPEWVANAKAATSDKGVKKLCYATDVPQLTTSCATGKGFWLEDGDASKISLNELAEDQNGYTTRTTAAGYTKAHWFEPHAAHSIYTLKEITDWRNAQYKPKLPCSKVGQCDSATGNCKCKSGYLGIDCGKEAKDFK